MDVISHTQRTLELKLCGTDPKYLQNALAYALEKAEEEVKTTAPNEMCGLLSIVAFSGEALTQIKDSINLERTD